MRIVCENAGKHISALAAALSYEHQVVLWNSDKKSAYDMWDECMPEIIIANRKILEKYDTLFTCKKLDISDIPTTLANSVQLLGGVYSDRYKSKYVYFSDRPWESDPSIINTLSQYKNLRIYGDYWIPLPNYVGKVTLKETADILQSVDHVLDFDDTWVNNAVMVGKSAIRNGHEYKLDKNMVLSSLTYLIWVSDYLDTHGIDTSKLEAKNENIYNRFKD